MGWKPSQDSYWWKVVNFEILLSFNKSELVAEGRMLFFFVLIWNKGEKTGLYFKSSESARVISKFKPFPVIV